MSSTILLTGPALLAGRQDHSGPLGSLGLSGSTGWSAHPSTPS